MRARLLIPILILSGLFCVVLGVVVYSNVTTATHEFFDRQLDDTLRQVESELLEAQNASGSLSDAKTQSVVKRFASMRAGVFVVNAGGYISADSQGVLTGQNVAHEDWYRQIEEESAKTHTFSYGGEEIYARSLVFGEKLIVSFLPYDTIEAHMTTPLYVIGVVGLSGLIIIGVLIYFLLTRLLINPVESLEEQVSLLEKGESISLKPLSLCPEVASIAEQLNDLGARQMGGADRSDNTEISAALSVEQTGSAIATTDQEPGTSFELVQLLREVFEPYRAQIEARELQFSLRVNKDIPQVIVAQKAHIASQITSLFAEAFARVQSGSKVSVAVSLKETPQFSNNKVLAIAFHIKYNDYVQTICFDAKRGN